MIDRATFDRRCWLGVGLIVSLAINAFFIGAAATDVLRTTKDRDRGSSLLRYELRWLNGLLTDDAMAAIKAEVAGGRPRVERRIDRLR